ncbi:hypothetical protein DICA4_B00782 [Diutina catenulata]
MDGDDYFNMDPRFEYHPEQLPYYYVELQPVPDEESLSSYEYPPHSHHTSHRSSADESISNQIFDPPAEDPHTQFLYYHDDATNGTDDDQVPTVNPSENPSSSSSSDEAPVVDYLENIGLEEIDNILRRGTIYIWPDEGQDDLGNAGKHRLEIEPKYLDPKRISTLVQHTTMLECEVLKQFHPRLDEDEMPYPQLKHGIQERHVEDLFAMTATECNPWCSHGSTPVDVPPKRRRSPMTDELVWEPQALFSAFTDCKPKDLKGDNGFFKQIPVVSCFGKINMRQRRAWSRGPNKKQRYS